MVADEYIETRHAHVLKLHPANPPLVLSREQVAAAAAAYSRLAFHDAIDAIMLLCSKGNQLMEESKPWVAYKNVS